MQYLVCYSNSALLDILSGGPTFGTVLINREKPIGTPDELTEIAQEVASMLEKASSAAMVGTVQILSFSKFE